MHVTIYNTYITLGTNILYNIIIYSSAGTLTILLISMAAGETQKLLLGKIVVVLKQLYPLNCLYII